MTIDPNYSATPEARAAREADAKKPQRDMVDTGNLRLDRILSLTPRL
jgi:hypothetical protein